MKALPEALRRMLCRVGRHRWETERYMSIGNVWCEEDVCRQCPATRNRRRAES